VVLLGYRNRAVRTPVVGRRGLDLRCDFGLRGAPASIPNGAAQGIAYSPASIPNMAEGIGKFSSAACGGPPTNPPCLVGQEDQRGGEGGWRATTPAAARPGRIMKLTVRESRVSTRAAVRSGSRRFFACPRGAKLLRACGAPYFLIMSLRPPASIPNMA
jgi:hypothetical protein